MGHGDSTAKCLYVCHSMMGMESLVEHSTYMTFTINIFVIKEEIGYFLFNIILKYSSVSVQQENVGTLD